MEGPFRLLLLLALLLPAAAAATVMEGPQPCEPALLATKVAHLCATDLPSDSEHCCEAVVAAVDLGSCLCRVAAEPKLVAAGLNATSLVYTSCGGLRAHLAACQGPAPPAAVVFAPPPSPGPRRTQQPPHEAPPSTTEKPPQQRDGATHSKATSSPAPAAAISPAVPHSAGSSSSQVYVSGAGAGARYDNKCAARQLADRLVLTCDTSENAPSPICCQIVSTIVEQSCLCQVSEEAQVRESSHMGRQHILFLYNICGGEQQVPPGQCGPIYPPPPPPSSPVVSHGRVSLSVLLPSLLGGFVGLLGIGYGVYTLVKWAKLHGFFGGEQPRLLARDAAAAAAEARARAAREAAGDVQQTVGGAHFAV